ncbi:immunoglobulin-like domain-containing protein, partial [Maribacter stanieri]
VDTDIEGVYNVTYDVVDAAGNPADQVIREVIVKDIEQPVILLNGGSIINLNVGDEYTELGATATDNSDDNVSSAIVIGG